MEDTFICPECETKWNRNEHYRHIIDIQMLIMMFSGNPKTITDMCSRCNHIEVLEDDINE